MCFFLKFKITVLLIMKFTQCLSSPIGYLIIKGTEEYIESITFSDEKLKSSKRLPKIFTEVKHQLKEYFSGRLKEFTFTVQQEGTIFQKYVWNELDKIPYGKIVSYKTIAYKMGDTNKSRAVGNSTSKNAIAIVVPCHRVIGESGKLVGYVGGLWRKKWLLEMENKIKNGVQSLF